ncbi:HORMA domain-containing protein [Abortiporus biennis]|nr:HORMA domain-containing protein [Abortiporus biennis]
MQKLRTERQQDTLTSQQSLQSIQTLLKAGLGCITYLRNLLPADNFSESYLTSSNTDSLSSQPSRSFSSFSTDQGKRNVSGFKIMTVTRGYTEEADKLLDFMENGIFDALQKEYLKSFIFAVYLDNDDPNNIVEAYTFNFHYHTIPGTSTTVPVMSLGDDLMKLSISGKGQVDPVANATIHGRVPTLGEVKRSLKSLIKNLIQATTQMDALPKRRYATFKLYYYDHTPEDYEPPHFRAGDVDKDKWFFTTHDRNEVPEKCSIGQVKTGWHGVDVKVASVTSYLPSLEDNNAPFLGTVCGQGATAPPLTPAEEAITRAQQVDAQRRDAQERNVVWNAEEAASDIKSEDDMDQDAIPIRSNSQVYEPVGIRDTDGTINPCEPNQDSDSLSTSISEVRYVGEQENVPSQVGQLEKTIPLPEDFEQTQQLDIAALVGKKTMAKGARTSSSISPSRSPTPTPKPRTAACRVTRSMAVPKSLPPSDVVESSISSASSFEYREGETIDTQELRELMIEHGTAEDEEMLDMETQVVPEFLEQTCEDSIETTSSIEGVPPTSLEVPVEVSEDNGVECECGVPLEDCDCIFCEGGCKRWFHAWCMGYHAGSDPNAPKQFICFDCRVRGDQNWELIMLHDLYPRMMERFRDLALFRRAIKVYETSNPPGLSGFTKLLACEPIVAGQLFKRLESEGFIVLEAQESDELGLMETTTAQKNGKRKGNAKAAKGRRSMQKTKYAFSKVVKNMKVYKDMFNADPEVEKRILGLSDLKPARKMHTRKNARQVAALEDEDMYELADPGAQQHARYTDLVIFITQRPGNATA